MIKALDKTLPPIRCNAIMAEEVEKLARTAKVPLSRFLRTLVWEGVIKYGQKPGHFRELKMGLANLDFLDGFAPYDMMIPGAREAALRGAEDDGKPEE